MLRLYLLRHAKSSWADPGLADYDRPLNSRGREAAPAMAAFMAARGLLPEKIICSSAERAKQTLSLMLPRIASETTVLFTRRVYEEGGSGYIDIARQHGGDAASLMLVGHNPSMEDAATMLSGHGDPDMAFRMRMKYPTAGLAIIDFDLAGWPDIGPGKGRLTGFHTPRSIEDEE